MTVILSAQGSRSSTPLKNCETFARCLDGTNDWLASSGNALDVGNMNLLFLIIVITAAVGLKRGQVLASSMRWTFAASLIHGSAAFLIYLEEPAIISSSDKQRFWRR